MASPLLRACSVITNSLKQFQNLNNGPTKILNTRVPLTNAVRNLNFFNGKSAELLWKGVTSVSNPGRKRGRAKGLSRKKDLNKGQLLGIGKVHVQFPGLNAPIYRGRELVRQTLLPPIPDREEKLIKLREQHITRKEKLHPLERGWTSATMGGRKLGPPDPVGDETFEDFQSWVLESRLVAVMNGNVGRKRRNRGLVVVGNGKGLAGFAVANAVDQKQCLNKAKNRAIQKLLYIQRYKEHSVVHDFFAQFGKTKVHVRQMPPGYGLVCHRALKACCEAIGIKDMYAKVEGSRNTWHTVKAFFIGLLQQRSFEQLAEEKKLHVVQFNSATYNFPTVLASPKVARTKNELQPNEILDFRQYLMDGKILLQKPKRVPFYTKLPSWQYYLRKQERLRNQHDVRIKLEAEYGGIRSFLTEKYPEADGHYYKQKKEEEN